VTKSARRFLVTGVSQGLGHAIFEKLIAAGLDPIAIGRSFTQEQMQRYEARDCHLLTCDLTETAAIASLPLTLLEDAFGIVFIANAGMIAPIGMIGARPSEQVLASGSVNFLAPALLTDRLTALARRTGAKLTIINISSGAARQPVAGWSAYCAAKAGISMFFACLAAENPAWEIRDVDPGVLDTRMQAEIREASFPAIDDFRNLRREGRLRPPAQVADEILAPFLS
jgi:NAD(P)-dependent dehydrogenase (short-subunit alcohol dehydrogenase family)